MDIIQVRLTPELINEIKILVDLGLYPTVSEAVRDAVRMLVTTKERSPLPKLAEQKQAEAAAISAEVREQVEKVQQKIQKEIIKQFQAPKGTEDYYPEDLAPRNEVFSIMRDTAGAFGFLEVDSPVLEDLNLLKAKQGEEIVNQIFVTEKKGEEELALRAEFTPSLARMFIAKQKSIPKPVKWFCINRVFRYERPQQGRQREFFQFNVEMYGSSTPESDAEIVLLASQTLLNLGLSSPDFRISLNNRKLIQGLLLEIVKEERLDAVLRIIDKRKKISPEAFDEELEKANIDTSQINKINQLLKKPFESLAPTNPLAVEGFNELKTMLVYLTDVPVMVDLSTVRGLAYYTGMVFEIFDSAGKFRSIAGGGRYDNMIGLFKGDPTPATGFGMGWSTLRLLLKEKGKLPAPSLGVDYCIITIGDVKKEAFKIAQQLRQKYSVMVDVVGRNLKNQFDYANKIGARNALIIGPDELAKNVLKVKNLSTAAEQTTTIRDILSA